MHNNYYARSNVFLYLFLLNKDFILHKNGQVRAGLIHKVPNHRTSEVASIKTKLSTYLFNTGLRFLLIKYGQCHI